MVAIPLAKGDWLRKLAQQPHLQTLNRYFEQSPTNAADGVALLARPALRKWKELGSGPIQGIYSQPGSFEDALFVVSGGSLYRVNTDNTEELIGTGLLPGNPTGFVRMAATAAIGPGTPENLFVADGQSLWLYQEGGTWATVAIPDDLSPVAVAFIAGYIIVVIKELQGYNGRFFWIEPGEILIDPLNFATAERLPDPLHSCRTVGDQLWLFGTSTTEIWYPTGDFNFPFTRTQGQVFDRGIVEGTDVQVQDTIYITDNDGNSYVVTSGSATPISTPAIVEQNREALKLWGA